MMNNPSMTRGNFQDCARLELKYRLTAAKKPKREISSNRKFVKRDEGLQIITEG